MKKNEQLAIVDLAEWKKDAERSSKVVLRKHAPPVAVVKADGDSKPVRFVISDNTVDRDNDTIDVKGWDLSRYNGVVLFGHCSWEPAIGKSTVKIEGEKLMADAEFVSREVYDFGGMIGEMVRGGFMRSASVGFRPVEWEVSNDREPTNRWADPIDFKQQELLEWSVVTIPSNPNAHALSAAITAAKAAGLDVGPAAKWAERVLEDAHGKGAWVSRADLETLAKSSRVIVDMAAKRASGVEVVNLPFVTPAAKDDDGDEVVTMGNHLETMKACLASMKDMQTSHANAMADLHQKMGALHEQLKSTQADLHETQKKIAAHVATMADDKAFVAPEGKSGDHTLSGAQYKRIKTIAKTANAALAAHHADDGAPDGGDGEDTPPPEESTDSGKALAALAHPFASTEELDALAIEDAKAADAAELEGVLRREFEAGTERVRQSIDTQLSEAKRSLVGKPN